jgi:hypothetical protein
MDREQLERWLAEEESGDDAAADAAFAPLFAAVRKVDPQDGFVDRAVVAAWRWRARRRRVAVFAWAAALLVVGAGALMAFLMSPRVATLAVKTLAAASGHAVPWLVAYARVALDWWWTLGHVGGVIASALLTPARAAAIVGVELFGIIALFALLRIAGASRLGEAQV